MAFVYKVNPLGNTHQKQAFYSKIFQNISCCKKECAHLTFSLSLHDVTALHVFKIHKTAFDTRDTGSAATRLKPEYFCQI